MRGRIGTTGCLPVGGVRGTGQLGPHHQEHVLEVRADGGGAKGPAAWFLEHDGHNVVANVALPQELGVRWWGMSAGPVCPPSPS